MAGLLDIKQRGLLDIAQHGDGGLLSSYTPSLRDKVKYWLARNWYGDTREGVDQAGKLSDVLETVTPYGLLTSAYDAGRAGGSGDYLGAGVAGAMAALPLPAPVEKEAKQGIRAFHGSPHSFDRFSMDKIGTGEGAQAYGHGLYFAENEGVAKNYRDALSPSPNTTQDIAQRAVAENGGDTTKAADSLAQYLSEHSWKMTPSMAKEMQDAEQFLRSGGKLSPGSMYEVRINANPDDFLDWDKPFQSADDLERFAAKFDPVDPTLRKRIEDYGYVRQQQGGPMPDGNDIVREVLGGIGSKDAVRASQTMKEAGIPGIKYLDAGSRGKGDGSRNYVVFDDKLIEIVRKYGIAGATALVGYNFMPELTADQQKQLKMIEG